MEQRAKAHRSISRTRKATGSNSRGRPSRDRRPGARWDPRRIRGSEEAEDFALRFARKLSDRRIDSATDPDLSLVRLTEADLPLVRRWLGSPHVARWWGAPDEEIRQIRDHLAGGCVTPFLMVEAGRPLGYLQVYHANGDPFWQGCAFPRETFGLDLSIGEVEATGRGLGPRFLRIVLDRLFAMPEVARVHIDPAPDNAIAIRAYEKAGFRREGLIDTPDGPALYMSVERGA